MTKAKNTPSIAHYFLIKRSEFDTQGRDTRTAYQVIESDGNVAGLFGSLNEAKMFLNMLGRLTKYY